jgi:4-amino-4-deoxy-L-arabinose transferase-like glycosyltransferase
MHFSVNMNHHSLCAILTRGIIGTVAPLLGALASYQEQLEFWLRVVALVLGILISIVTLVSFFLHHKTRDLINPIDPIDD